MKYAGADWIQRGLKVKMSPLGIKVADLLGQVFLGIYHLPIEQLRKVDWSRDIGIEYKHPYNLATFDGDELTRLVLLSHDYLIRVSIAPSSNHYVELMFHERKSREGSIYERMPTLENHTAILRETLKITPST